MTLYDVLMMSLTKILTDGWGHGDPEFHHEYYKVKLQIPHCMNTSLIGPGTFTRYSCTITYGNNHNIWAKYSKKRAVLMRKPLFTFLQEAVLPDR